MQAGYFFTFYVAVTLHSCDGFGHLRNKQFFFAIYKYFKQIISKRNAYDSNHTTISSKIEVFQITRKKFVT